jgi:nitrite reductase (cytochrome c-552)
MYNQGVHARAGVACSDCHMPYKRTGAMKISDHHVRSPLLNVDKACQTCHRWSEEELRTRVFVMQDRTFQLRNLAIDAVLELTKQIQVAARADSAGPRVQAARGWQRKAQFFTDFVEAENSMGFHADQEAARILANAINYARLGQAALRGEPVAPPQPNRVAPPQTVSPAGGRE